MYVMFQLRPFTVHNVFPCFYGPNKVIIIKKPNLLCIVDEVDIATKFNTFFTEIGFKLASNIKYQ